LVTLSGGVGAPGVYEIPLGSRLADVLRMADADPASLSGVLVGGYFGAWLSPTTVADVRLGVAELRQIGGGLGAGIVFAMPRDTCALAEVARATRWLADQNAGQCGPCVNGLDAIADAMRSLVAGDREGRAHRWIVHWLSMMEGRGACRHPDGVARFVASSLRVFEPEILRHRHGGPCAGGAALLPTPPTGGWR
jgi:NADH:ubiquinone oxidoreductase subunit F (NADH-binding)